MLIGAPPAWRYALADYQKVRLINMINPETDPLDVDLQQIQGRISTDSGQMFGRELFEGPRVARSSVPV